MAKCGHDLKELGKLFDSLEYGTLKNFAPIISGVGGIFTG